VVVLITMHPVKRAFVRSPRAARTLHSKAAFSRIHSGTHSRTHVHESLLLESGHGVLLPEDGDVSWLVLEHGADLLQDLYAAVDKLLLLRVIVERVDVRAVVEVRAVAYVTPTHEIEPPTALRAHRDVGLQCNASVLLGRGG
jgi:hypothetical protein